MDLNDSFVNMTERMKARRDYLNAIKTEFFNAGNRKRVALVDDHQMQNEAMHEPPEESPKRQCMQSTKDDLCSHENDNDKENNENVNMQTDENIPFVTVHANVKGLAALRRADKKGVSEDELNTGFPPSFQTPKDKTYVYSTNSKDLCTGPKSKLAHLANDIRHWENDIQKPAIFSDQSTSKSDGVSSAALDTPNSSKSNAFAVKLYYANKSTKNENLSYSEKQCQSEPVNKKIDGKTLQVQERSRILMANKSDVKNSSGPSKDRKLDAWNQAISATLDSQDRIRSPTTLPNEHHTEQDLNDDSEQNGSDIHDEEGIKNENECDDLSCENANLDDLKQYKPASVKNGTENNFTKLTQDKSVLMNKKPNEPGNLDVDPAELPLSARKALFEKALLHGASKQSEFTDHKMTVAQRAAIFENVAKVKSLSKSAENYQLPKHFLPPKSSSALSVKSNVLQHKAEESTKLGMQNTSNKMAFPSCSDLPSPNKNVGSHTRLVQQKLLENTNNWQNKDTVMSANKERKKEISSLVTHWEKLSSAKTDSDEKHIQHIQDNTLDQQRDIFQSYEAQRVSENEESKCNVHTSSDENDEVHSLDNEVSDTDESVFDTRGIMQQAAFSAVEEQDDLESKISDCNRKEMGEIRNEEQPERRLLISRNIKNEFVLPESESSISSSGNSSVSNAHSCASSTSVVSCASASLSLKSDDTSSNINANVKSDLPLLHTVSFYRKQKQEMRTPPIRTIVRREQILSPPDNSDFDHTEAIQERIKALQEEVLKQQTIISQSSQALNLCNATAEFCGSAEQVEGERLLLIATQRRQACLNEIQRLKAHGARGENISDGTGTLIITDIQLPLKRNFVASQLENANDMVHYFMCLIRHGAQVIVTQMVSTSDKLTDGALCFTNHIKLQELPADFSVVFEVYALQAKKEILPHEKKYHIKREHSKIRLTPKGKKGDGRILLPAISSPGGPNAVRSPSFGVIGYTRFTLQNCNKRAFALDKVPFTSPLDGVLKVKLQLHAEHKVTGKGFLTMFDDVSGFGAWHRRWCSLDGHLLVYWKYPDDEHRKEPIGAIDLKQCITGQVRLVASDVCARSHTFQLVTVRPLKEGDKNTLISRCINTLTTTKHLLSADTKEERILWCNKLNDALTNVRKWDPQALRPMEGMQD